MPDGLEWHDVADFFAAATLPQAGDTSAMPARGAAWRPKAVAAARHGRKQAAWV